MQSTLNEITISKNAATSNEIATSNNAATSNDTVYIKWYCLHLMIQPTFNDKVYINDMIYI